MKLTEKQKRFCDEYLIDLNATQAAIRAGYSEKTAKDIAAQNLAKLNIQAHLQQRMQARQERLQITQDYVIEVIRDTVEKCRAPEAWDAKNVLKGCELLGKHLGMFVERRENTHSFLGKNGELPQFEIITTYVYPGGGQDDELSVERI